VSQWLADASIAQQSALIARWRTFATEAVKNDADAPNVALA
jgi:hypothetical protein